MSIDYLDPDILKHLYDMSFSSYFPTYLMDDMCSPIKANTGSSSYEL